MYIINFTDITKPPIVIKENQLLIDKIDIVLIGKSTNEYGQELNENTLHLLENFACLADPSGNFPSKFSTFGKLLESPITGQFWYDTTNKILNFYNGKKWTQLKLRTDIRVLSGVILHGQQIPLPATLSYDECSIMVSPQYIDQKCNYIECFVDTNNKISIRYRSILQEIIEGVANYIVIGIKNSNNNLIPFPDPTFPPLPSVTPTLTITPTLTPTSTPTIGVTRTPTISATPTLTQTSTSTLTPTPTLTPSVTRTPTVTVSQSSVPLTTIFLQTEIVTNFGISFNVGFDNTMTISPNVYGQISPSSYNGFPIKILLNSKFNTDNKFIVTMGGTPGTSVFSSIRFVDNIGNLRIFNLIDSNTSIDGFGNRTWMWSISNTENFIFDINVSYIIQIIG